MANSTREEKERAAKGAVFCCRYDSDWTLVRADESLFHFLGYTREEFKERFDNKMAGVIDPQDMQPMYETVERQLKDGNIIFNENRLHCADGTVKWIWITAELMHSETEGEYFYCMFYDITERVLRSQQLTLSENRYDIIMRQTQDTVFEWNCLTDEVYYSPNFERKFGYKPPATGPRTLTEQGVIHPDDCEPFLQYIEKLEQGEETMAFECRVRRLDGAYLWVRIHTAVIRGAKGSPERLLGIISDIQEQKLSILNAENEASRDPLTNLYNHKATEKLISRCLTLTRGTAALLVIDVDNFKGVNDTLGHIYGDAVLSDLAFQLKRLFRATDVVGRVGGDEFVVFIQDLADSETVDRKAAEIMEIFHRSLSNRGVSYEITGSLGAAFFPEDGTTYQELFERADLAMYHSKNSGKNRFTLYNEAVLTEKMRPRFWDGQIDESEMMPKNLRDNVIEYLFRIFLENPDIEKALPILLDLLGNLYRLGRAYIYEPLEGPERLRCTFEWCGKGIPSMRCMYPSSEDIEKSESACRLWFERRGARAGLLCPIREKDRTVGFVGYETFGGDKDLPEEVRNTLVLAAEAISLVLTRARKQEQLQQQKKFSDRAEFTSQCVDVTEQMKLQQQLELYRIALRQINTNVWEYDLGAHTITMTENAEVQHGYTKVIEGVPESLIEAGHIHPSSVADFRALYSKLYSGEKQVKADILTRTADGNGWWWERITYTTIFDENGAPARAAAVGEDVTRQKESEIRYQQELQLRYTLSEGLIASCRVNLTRDRVESLQIANQPDRGPQEGMGYEELLELGMSAIENANDRKRFAVAFSKQALAEAYQNHTQTILLEYRRKDTDGRLRWVNSNMRLVKDAVSGDFYAYGSVRNIDSRKSLELALIQRAEKDTVTNTYSRETAIRMIGEALALEEKERKGYALLVFVVDNFSRIISQDGYSMAEKALLELVDLIGIKFGLNQIVGRFYGDEVVVFLRNGPQLEEICAGAGEICRLVGTSVMFADAAVPLIVRAGLVFGVGGEEFKTLYDRAHIALEEAEFDPEKRCAVYGGRTGAPAANGCRESSHAQGIRRQIKRLMQKKQQYLSYHDSLTGLLNRNSFVEYSRSLQEESLIAMGVVSVDINGLKRMNTRYGSKFGDEMVRRTAKSMKQAFAEGHVYRFGGDEFLAVCENLTREAFMEQIAFLREQMADPPFCISIGYVWADTGIYLDTMIRHADEKMLIAKKEYYKTLDTMTKGYDPILFKQLSKGLEQGAYQMFLQPKADILTGEIAGAEALVRCNDPENGLIGPDKFVPILEKEGLIRYIDLFMFESVCWALAKWSAEGRKLLPVSLNFSRATLLEERLIDTMEEIRSKYGIKSALLEIEITESLGEMERDTVAHIGQQIRAKGYRLSLDDFGARYSSLAILSIMKLDVLKVDKTLVDDLLSNATTKVLMRNLLCVCREIEIHSVAEGVETKEQLEILRELGCDYAQGYYFNKAIPLEDFEKLYLN